MEVRGNVVLRSTSFGGAVLHRPPTRGLPHSLYIMHAHTALERRTRQRRRRLPGRLVLFRSEDYALVSPGNLSPYSQRRQIWLRLQDPNLQFKTPSQ